MKVVICGGGQVGSSIARQLAGEGNDVTIIDQSQELIRSIGDTLDVKALTGFASHPSVLERAGAADADMLIAVTVSDEVNMVACQVAHSIFNIPTKIARVRHQNYLDPIWNDLYRKDHLPIDFIISPEIEVANAINRRLHLPGALDMVPFADGRIRLVATRCTLGAPAAGKPACALLVGNNGTPSVTVVGIVRNDQFTTPGAEDLILPGDSVYFVAAEEEVHRAMVALGHEETEAHRVIILGGGNIGLFLAEKLEAEDQDIRCKVIEVSKERAEFVAEQLKRTTVIHGSGMDREILIESNVEATETVIAVTNDDKVNILASLLAKRYGCQRTIALVNNLSYSPLIGTLGIDAVVNPRETTISSILQHVRRGRIRGVHSIHGGAAELIEAEAMETSAIVGKTLPDIRLPSGVVIGAILRNDKVIIPDSDTQIHAHDRILILSRADMVKKVEKFFSVRLEYF